MKTNLFFNEKRDQRGQTPMVSFLSFLRKGQCASSECALGDQHNSFGRPMGIQWENNYSTRVNYGSNTGEIRVNYGFARQFVYRVAAMLLMLVTMSVGQVLGETVTFDYSHQTNSYVSLGGNATWSSSDGYHTGNSNETITLTPSSGVTITGVVFTFTSNSKDRVGGEPSVSTGSYSCSNTTGTWSGLSATSAIVWTANNKFRITSLTVTYTAGGACSWNINYITNGKKDSEGGKEWSENNCFTQVGSTNEWRLENFVMPNLRGQFWVGPGSFKNTGGGHSAIADLTTIKICQHDLGLPSSTYSPMAGGIGTLVIWSNSGESNYAVRFLPTYQITYDNDGDSNWESYPFAWVNDHEYQTDILQIPSGYATKDFYVGCKKEDGTTSYVMWENGGGNDEKSKTKLMNTMGGLTSGDMTGKYGKFTIYDNSGSQNWYCSFTEYYVVELYDRDVKFGDTQSSLASAPGKIVFSTPDARTGYTFGGWQRDGDSYTVREGDSDWTNYGMWKSYERFNAVWTANQYTITYKEADNSDFAGSNGASLPGTHTYGSATALIAGVRAGYTFDGWYTEPELTNKVTSLAADGYTANITLYAKWSLAASLVAVSTDTEFNFSEGTWTPGSVSNNMEIGSECTLDPNGKSMDGYDFTKRLKFGGTMSATRYVAIRVAGPCAITVYGMSGSASTTRSLKILSGSTSGTVLKANFLSNDGNAIGKDTYDYTGSEETLYIGSSGSGFNIYMVKVTFGAPTPTTYNLTVTDEAVGCERNESGLTEGQLVTITNSCSVPGRHLTGYTPNAVPNYSFDAETKTLTFNMPASDVTLTAVWEDDAKYTVTFDENGATSGDAPAADGNHDNGDHITLPANTGNMALDGHVFSGWNTAADGRGTNYNVGADYTITGDVTLYARWKAQYTVTLDKNGGTTDGSVKVVYGSSNTSNASAPVFASYEILGYYAEPECTTKVMNANFSLVEDVTGWTNGFNWAKNENATLYTKWDIPTYTVTFDINGATGSTPTETPKMVGARFALPTADGFTYAGKTFAGWKSSANDVTYAAGDQYTMTAANTTFTAQWREVSQWHTIAPNIVGTNYESYPFSETHDGNSVASTFTNWVSGNLYGTSSSSWSGPARFRTSGKYGKIRGTEIVFKVTNCKSVAVLGKSGSTSRGFNVTVYNEDKTQVIGTNEDRSNTVAQVLVEGLTPASNYVVVVSSTDKGSNSDIYSISFEAPGAAPCETPNITAQQTASATYCAGDGVTALSVTASVSDGGSLSYQWYKGEDAIDDAVASSFTPSESGSYKCIVTNTKAGKTNAQAASEVAVITINAATAITTQPTANQTVPAGSQVSLTVAATGSALTYQWKSCATIDGTYEPIVTVAATKATYTFTPNAVGNTYYKCAVTGACGEVLSNAAYINVTTAAPTVTWNTETSVYQGQLLPVSVTTNSDAVLAVGNLTTDAGTLRGVTLAGKTFTGYLEVPADAAGTITLTLNTATGTTFSALVSNHEITVDACPAVGTLYNFQLTAAAQNVTTEQTATGGTATFGNTIVASSTIAAGRYAAKLDGNAGRDNSKYLLVTLDNALKKGDVVTIKGYTTSTPSSSYSFLVSDSRTASKKFAVLTNTARNTEEELKFTVTDAASGAGATSLYITRNGGSVYLTGVTVAVEEMKASLAWDDAEVTDGGTLEKTFGDADFTIPAISNSIGTIGYTSGTPATATVNASTGAVHIQKAGTTVITATVATAGCYVTKSITYTLRVNAACEAPIITRDLSTETVEYAPDADATALSITATGSTLTYQWYKNTTNDTETGTLIGGATTASYKPSTAELGTTYYYCVVSSGACTTTSAVAKIVVMQAACFDDAVETSLSSSDATYVIDLGVGSSFGQGTVIYGRVRVGTVKGGDGVKVQNTTINLCAGTNIAVKDTWYDFAYVVPANSPLIGKQSITLVRASGTTTRIKDIKVTGCETPCALDKPLIVAADPVLNHETCQQTVLLTAKTPDGSVNYNITGGSMQWYKDGEAIPSATAVTYNVTEEGSYYVKFTNGCSVMSSNSYVEDNLEAGVQRLAPLQYYHVGKTYTEQMKDRHLFVVNSLGTHSSGNKYLLEAQLNGEDYNVQTIRSAIYSVADDDVANTDTVMIDLNALNGKGFNVGDELELFVSPVNLCDNYDETLKQSITIYMIDETPTLAFIVSGADGAGTKTKANFKLDGDFLTGYNKADLKTQTSATAVSEAELPLYTALRSEFNVTPVNGYAKFNLFNYEPYDLLFLTDFVKSDGSADKAAAKKHVEALGNLVDYRPMFSTKSHMSGFNNWKEKGFTANPTVPKQTQVLMSIVCYAHPMFEGLTPDGDNIYYDAIDNNETVFRMLSQGGYDSNKGIQGFEMNGANEFIKIALTHFDAHGTPAGNIMTPTAEADDRTLIASCERQANIEARFIILSLNADATGFLTEAGIDVIVRSLDYLLETNPVKVTDCHFEFDNDNNTGIWSDPANSAPNHNLLPSKNVDVRIAANCIVDNTAAVAAGVKVKEGVTLTIAANGALTIQGIAQHVSNEGVLSPTSPSDLVVSGNSTGTGAFIHGDEAGRTGATVEMYSPATATVNDGGNGATNALWQWITTPYNDVYDAQYNYYGAWMYSWDNVAKAWSPQVVNGTAMTPFGGYALTQENAKTYTMTGTLVGTANQTIELNYNTERSNGLNLIGNSWTAPIDITKMSTADFTNATANIIMFNTGKDVTGNGAVTSDGTDPRTPGTYVSIPVETASSLPASLQVIPAMQGFEVKASATGASLKLDYNKIVRGTDAVNIQAIRTPGRHVESSDNGIDERLLIMVHGSRYSDFLYLFHNAETTMGFDNGWDGEKMYSDNYDIPVLYVENADGDWQISTQPELAGTTFGFYKGEDTQYTISFEYNGDEELWLYDATTNIYTAVETGNIYSFTSTFVSDDPERRFVLTNYNPNAPQNPGIATGVDDVSPDSGPRKLILNDKLFILNNGRLYDATGRLAY